MYRSTLCAICATAIAFSALAGAAHAQISGTIGGDIVACDPLHVFGPSPFAPGNGTDRHGGLFAHCPSGPTNAR
jgi:hypothetical protein